jgi:hypothetical protein
LSIAAHRGVAHHDKFHIGNLADHVMRDAPWVALVRPEAHGESLVIGGGGMPTSSVSAYRCPVRGGTVGVLSIHRTHKTVITADDL